MQISREEFESRLDNLKVEIFDEDDLNDIEDEEFGDDGEPVKDYPEEDEVMDILNKATDAHHAITDTMTDIEYAEYQKELSYKRFNKFLKDKNYEVKC